METLRAWRETKKMTVAEAAAEAGVERATWWRWETGVRAIGLESLKAVSDMTGIPATVLRPDLATFVEVTR